MLPGIAVVPVLLPGREGRFLEPPVESVEAATAALMEDAARLFERPYAIFGHSMGALLGYAWARAIECAGAPGPAALFLSGRNAAHLPQSHRRLHALDDEEFLAELRRRYGGTAHELLESAETRGIFLPALRADLKLVETYVHAAAPMLDCPIDAFAGSDDASVSDEGMAGWAELTRGEFRQRRFAGDHFYHLGASQGNLLDAMRERLGEVYL